MQFNEAALLPSRPLTTCTRTVEVPTVYVDCSRPGLGGFACLKADQHFLDKRFVRRQCPIVPREHVPNNEATVLGEICCWGGHRGWIIPRVTGHSMTSIRQDLRGGGVWGGCAS